MCSMVCNEPGAASVVLVDPAGNIGGTLSAGPLTIQQALALAAGYRPAGDGHLLPVVIQAGFALDDQRGPATIAAAAGGKSVQPLGHNPGETPANS